jgi:hypothetical protein
MTTTKKLELPSFESYAGKTGHTLVFSMGPELDVYFSYQTPVAFRLHGELVVSTNKWSATTARHLSAIDGGTPEARAARVGLDFATMLSDALELAS